MTADRTASDPVGGPEPQQWQRLHPLTPYLRSWALLAAAAAGVVANGSSVLSGLDDLFGGGASPAAIGWAVLVAIVVLGAYTLWAVLSWRMTRYRLDADALEYQTGVIFRQHRQARLDRLQAVDVVRSVIARLLGLAELRLEVAGGSGSDVRLQYLPVDDSRRLRRILLARSVTVGETSAATPQADGAAVASTQPERHLLSVPAGRLVASWLLGSATVVALLALAVVIPFAVLVPGLVVVSIPSVLAMVAGAVRRVAGVFGFTAADGADGLRLRYGLLETRTQTVPVDRVQAVAIEQPMLWRLRDWWTVEVNIAGYGSDASSGQVMLPVGTRAEAMTMLAQVLPAVSPGRRPLIDAGLTGRTGAAPPAECAPEQRDVTAADVPEFTVAPRRSRWLDPIGWRRNGFAATSDALLLRSGVLTRRLVVVPHARTQSIGVDAGPVQRALGLASVQCHSTPGPVRPVARHLTAATAARLVAEQAARAHRARSISPQPLPGPPLQWSDDANREQSMTPRDRSPEEGS